VLKSVKQVKDYLLYYISICYLLLSSIMTTLYKIIIDNRNYSNWSVLNATTLEPVSVHLEGNPLQHKLFTGDVFAFKQDNDNKIDIHYSPVRSVENIPAVLILNGNKTFGRANGLKGKLLYKCVPDDVRLPPFLVPYEHKHVGFSKVFSNLYVTIRFSDWQDKQIKAVISQTIGPVDIIDHFYEYQLYCKSLNSSIQKFTKDTNKALGFNAGKSEAHDAFIESVFDSSLVEKRGLDYKIFSIDPANSTDFDDAFSIKLLDDNMLSISIYIANVSILMDALNLWPSFSERISTIYLPDKKRPMLPSILSDCLCSLQSGSSRYAFVLDLTVNRETGEIVSTKYSNCLIQVKKNYVYEEPDLLASSDYLLLFDSVKKLSKQYKYISNVKNSHEVVSYLMILMNYFSAKELLAAKVGIFRSTVSKKKETTNDSLLSEPDSLLSEPDSLLPEDVSKFIKIWNSAYGQYLDISLLIDLDPSLYKHELLDMDAYIHITSPIRRLVDLLNMIKLQQVLGIATLSQGASNFYSSWSGKIDYINVTMRAIRRVQNDCALLDTSAKNLSVLDCIYDGYCFDKLVRNDGLFQYIVYLPELKMTSKITVRENMDNYMVKQYKLFLFNNEDKFKKKIRLHLVA
jgi:exoribonuclease R